MADLSVLIGRLLLAVLFAAGAVQKAVDPDVAGGLLTDTGLAYALVWPALVFDALAAVALVLGIAMRPVGLLLAAYCMATSVFHYLPADPWQMSILIKNWAIAGGCMVLAAHGPGRYAWAGPRHNRGHRAANNSGKGRT